MRLLATVALCLLLPVSAQSAELIKRSKTKAVINMKKSELTDLEVGEEVYLIDSADEATELMVEKINGQQVTVSGDIKSLETGIAYQVRLDKPQDKPEHASHSSDRDDDDDEDHDIATPLHLDVGYGKRWNSNTDGDGTRTDKVTEVRLAYQPDPLPLAVGIYFNQFIPDLNDESNGRIVSNTLVGMEYGLRFELNHHFDGFMPFFAVRVPVSKNLTGKYKVLYTEVGFVGTEEVTADFKSKATVSFDLGFNLHMTDSLMLTVLAQKGADDKVDAKLHSLQTHTSAGSTERSDIRVEGEVKFKYDELILGIAFHI